MHYPKKMLINIIFGLMIFIILVAKPTTSYAVSSLPEIYYGQLDNGFKYILVPLNNTDKGRIDVRIQVDAGSIDEQDDQIGIAHMVEHMVFRGSQKFPNGISNKLANDGWIRGQHYNAVTNYERTQYMFSPPNGVKGLRSTLEVIEQMMTSALFKADDWQNEQKIVYEEWRGGLGVANRMNQQRVQSIRYDSRYPNRPTIGTEQAILDAEVSKQATFYQTWYHPNNMRLLIIGDMDPIEVQQHITDIFASMTRTTLPTRNYYEPMLTKQLRVTRLQDSQSGTSQVSVVYRLDDTLAKQQDFAGVKQRLINQITLSMATKQLRRQQTQLPDEVSSLVIRKSDIGKTTIAVGLFANVLPDQHAIALTTLLTEIERFKQYPLQDQDLDEIKRDLLQTASKMTNSTEQREYAEWIQKLTIPLLNGERYLSSQQIGQWAEQIIADISQHDIQQNLLKWLSTHDLVIQYSVPGSTTYNPPNVSDIEQQWQSIATNKLPRPEPKPETTYTDFPDITFSGKILYEKNYPSQQTTVWQLENGDRVVWFNSPLAEGKLYFTANSQSGYLSPDLNPWQSQLATQLVKQTGPTGWHAEMFKAWLDERQLNFNVTLNDDLLNINGQFDKTKLATYLQIYTAMYQSPYIDPISMKESMIAYARQQASQTVSKEKNHLIAELRYGQLPYEQPNMTQLSELKPDTLLEQWHKLVATPTTFYLVANTQKDQLVPLIERYLAGIPRHPISQTMPYLSLSGSKTVLTADNLEPRANVSLWSFTPYQWTPEAAANVHIAKQIMQYYLKTALRDEMQGIYRIRTNSILNDKNNRIETEISFICAPERYEELIAKIKSVVSQIPSNLDHEQIEQEKLQFIKQEQLKKENILTLQNRLILSDRHYGNPSYLSNVDNLADSIDITSITQISGLILNTENLVINVTLPKQDTHP